MKVLVRLKESSQSFEYPNAKNTYQKGTLFCVYLPDEIVKKFPIESIFDITEDYGKHPTLPKS